MNSKKIFQLWYYNDLLDNNIKYEDLKIYCKNNNLILDNMLRTLPDYPNEKRRNGSYRGYHIIEVKNNNIVENVNNVTEDKKEIDFIKGRIRAEKIIHLNVENINERDILREFNLDIKEWQIEKLNYSLWDSPNKEKGSIPLYSVKCSFKRRDRLDYDIESLKTIIDNVLSVKNENKKK